MIELKNKKKHKALRKDFFIEIKKTYNRFLSLMLIVALGVAFYSGVRSTEPDMKLSADKLYDNSNFMDIKLLSLNGFSDAELDIIKNIDRVEQITGSYSLDTLDTSKNDIAVVKMMSQTDGMNDISIAEGRNVEQADECVVNLQYLKNMGYKLGDHITVKSGTQQDISYSLQRTKFKIVGTFTSPLYLQNDLGNSKIGNGKVSGAIYIQKDNFLLPVYTEAYIHVTGAKVLKCYSDKYIRLVNEVSGQIQNLDENYYVLDRGKHQQYVEFEMDADRVGKIGEIVPIIFFIVAALVSLTTMIRMVEEQRTQIGTLKALGYSNIMISIKYIMYGFLATILGCIIGGLIGGKIIPMIIINSYKIMYQNLTVIVTPINLYHFSLSVLLAMVCVVGATVAACFKTLISTSAELMRPLSPKQGKRIFLEYIPIIWRHVSFIWKSTIRNLVRYKKKIVMTIFGICGCMSLLLIGFGIKNSISSIVTTQYNELHTYDAVLTFENGLLDESKNQLLQEVAANKKVESTMNIYQAGAKFEFDGKDLEGYLYVPDDAENMKNFITLQEFKNKSEIDLNDNEVVITKKMANLLDVSKGDEINIEIGDTISKTAIVGDITENYVNHYVFMSNVLYKQLFGISAQSNQMLVNQVKEYKNENLSEEFLSIEGISSTNSIDTLKNTVCNMFKGLDIIIVVIVVAAGGLAFVVLYNLNTINIGERIRELATLKVLGFYDDEVSSYVFRENVVLTFMGIGLGYILGNILHEFVIDTVEVNAVMFGRDIYFSSYLYSTLITIFFVIIINFSMHFKLKKIDMTTSLKSVE